MVNITVILKCKLEMQTGVDQKKFGTKFDSTIVFYEGKGEMGLYS